MSSSKEGHLFSNPPSYILDHEAISAIGSEKAQDNQFEIVVLNRCHYVSAAPVSSID